MVNSAGAESMAMENGQSQLEATLTSDPEEPFEDDTIHITASILNNGTTPVMNLTVQLVIDEEVAGEWTSISIAPKDSYTFNITWDAEKGDHTVQLLVGNGQMQLLTATIISVDEVVSPVPALIGLGLIAVVPLMVALVPSVVTLVRVSVKKSKSQHKV